MTIIRIYQINTDRDINRVAFESYSSLWRCQGTSKIDSSLYDQVYYGTVSARDLEGIFLVFNSFAPKGYAGRSMSISDVVEVIESQYIETGFYYCDSVGFRKIRFDPSLTGGDGSVSGGINGGEDI